MRRAADKMTSSFRAPENAAAPKAAAAGGLHLRPLQEKDIPGMLEWMKDPAVNLFFHFDPAAVTAETAAAFVRAAQDTSADLHLACADDSGEYLGTISLKHIDRTNRNAEYAVSFRRCAQGTGAAAFATREILRRAFEAEGLEKVYLNVLAENTRARHFYEKNGFCLEGIARRQLFVRGAFRDLYWYGMTKERYLEWTK